MQVRTSWFSFSFQAAASLCLLALLSATPATAANLLLNNPSFESNTGFGGLGGAGTTYTTLPGWYGTEGAPTGFYGAANNQNAGDPVVLSGRDGTNFGYIQGNFTAATVAADRAIVTVGTNYTLSFLAANDLTTAGNLDVALNFYSDNITQGLAPLSGSLTMNLLNVPGHPAGSNSFALYSFSVTAPAGAAFAGVTIAAPFGSPANNQFLVDNVSITAVPEPASSLLAFVGLSALAWSRRRAWGRLQSNA